MYRRAIARTRVLLIISHPAVASGIETLLRLEGRYEVRRAATLTQAARLVRSWAPGATLVEASMLVAGTRVILGVPALVLAGNEGPSEAAARCLDDARGWVRKDASSSDLVAAVESVLTGGKEPVAWTLTSLPLFLLAALLVAFIALLLYLAWVALV